MRIQLSNKYKTLLLLGGIVITLYMSFKMAIGETLSLRSKYIENETNIKNTIDIPQKLVKVKEEIANWDNIIGGINEIENKQQVILNELSNYCSNNKLTIREFPKTHVVVENDFEVETDHVTIEGNYYALVRMLKEFEDKTGLGKISSVEFKTNSDYISHKKYLTMTIFFQNFKKIK